MFPLWFIFVSSLIPLITSSSAPPVYEKIFVDSPNQYDDFGSWYQHVLTSRRWLPDCSLRLIVDRVVGGNLPNFRDNLEIFCFDYAPIYNDPFKLQVIFQVLLDSHNLYHQSPLTVNPGSTPSAIYYMALLAQFRSALHFVQNTSILHLEAKANIFNFLSDNYLNLLKIGDQHLHLNRIYMLFNRIDMTLKEQKLSAFDIFLELDSILEVARYEDPRLTLTIKTCLVHIFTKGVISQVLPFENNDLSYNNADFHAWLTNLSKTHGVLGLSRGSMILENALFPGNPATAELVSLHFPDACISHFFTLYLRSSQNDLTGLLARVNSHHRLFTSFATSIYKEIELLQLKSAEGQDMNRQLLNMYEGFLRDQNFLAVFERHQSGAMELSSYEASLSSFSYVETLKFTSKQQLYEFAQLRSSGKLEFNKQKILENAENHALLFLSEFPIGTTTKFFMPILTAYECDIRQTFADFGVITAEQAALKINIEGANYKTGSLFQIIRKLALFYGQMVEIRKPFNYENATKNALKKINELSKKKMKKEKMAVEFYNTIFSFKYLLKNREACLKIFKAFFEVSVKCCDPVDVNYVLRCLKISLYSSGMDISYVEDPNSAVDTSILKKANAQKVVPMSSISEQGACADPEYTLLQLVVSLSTNSVDSKALACILRYYFPFEEVEQLPAFPESTEHLLEYALDRALLMLFNEDRFVAIYDLLGKNWDHPFVLKILNRYNQKVKVLFPKPIPELVFLASTFYRKPIRAPFAVADKEVFKRVFDVLNATAQSMPNGNYADFAHFFYCFLHALPELLSRKIVYESTDLIKPLLLTFGLCPLEVDGNWPENRFCQSLARLYKNFFFKMDEIQEFKLAHYMKFFLLVSLGMEQLRESSGEPRTEATHELPIKKPAFVQPPAVVKSVVQVEPTNLVLPPHLLNKEILGKKRVYLRLKNTGKLVQELVFEPHESRLHRMRILKDVIIDNDYDINELWICNSMNEKWNPPASEASETKVAANTNTVINTKFDEELIRFFEKSKPKDANKTGKQKGGKAGKKEAKSAATKNNNNKKKNEDDSSEGEEVSVKNEKKVETKQKKSQSSSQAGKTSTVEKSQKVGKIQTPSAKADSNLKPLIATEKTQKVEIDAKATVPPQAILKTEAVIEKTKEVDDFYKLFEFKANEIAAQPRPSLTLPQKNQILERIKAKNVPFPISYAFYSTLKGIKSSSVIQSFPAMEEWQKYLMEMNYKCECHKYELWRPEPFTFKVNDYGVKNQAKLSMVAKILEGINQEPALGGRLWSLCKYSSKNPETFSEIEIEFLKVDKYAVANKVEKVKTVEIKYGAVILPMGASEEGIRKALVEMLRVEEFEVPAPKSAAISPQSPPTPTVSNNKQTKNEYASVPNQPNVSSSRPATVPAQKDVQKANATPVMNKVSKTSNATTQSQPKETASSSKGKEITEKKEAVTAQKKQPIIIEKQEGTTAEKKQPIVEMEQQPITTEKKQLTVEKKEAIVTEKEEAKVEMSDYMEYQVQHIGADKKVQQQRINKMIDKKQKEMNSLHVGNYISPTSVERITKLSSEINKLKDMLTEPAINPRQRMQQLVKLIEEADYVALDFELTGVKFGPKLSMPDGFEDCKLSAKENSIVQLGIMLMKKDKDGNPMQMNSDESIWCIPICIDTETDNTKWVAESKDFLLKNGFDLLNWQVRCITYAQAQQVLEAMKRKPMITYNGLMDMLHILKALGMDDGVAELKTTADYQKYLNNNGIEVYDSKVICLRKKNETGKLSVVAEALLPKEKLDVGKKHDASYDAFETGHLFRVAGPPNPEEKNFFMETKWGGKSTASTPEYDQKQVEEDEQQGKLNVYHPQQVRVVEQNYGESVTLEPVSIDWPEKDKGYASQYLPLGSFYPSSFPAAQYAPSYCANQQHLNQMAAQGYSSSSPSPRQTYPSPSSSPMPVPGYLYSFPSPSPMQNYHQAPQMPYQRPNQIHQSFVPLPSQQHFMSQMPQHYPTSGNYPKQFPNQYSNQMPNDQYPHAQQNYGGYSQSSPRSNNSQKQFHPRTQK